MQDVLIVRMQNRRISSAIRIELKDFMRPTLNCDFCKSAGVCTA